MDPPTGGRCDRLDDLRLTDRIVSPAIVPHVEDELPCMRFLDHREHRLGVFFELLIAVPGTIDGVTVLNGFAPEGLIGILESQRSF